MSTSFSMLQIMNAALSAQGQDEITALNDGSDEFRVLSRNWPLIVEAELEDGNYHFTKEQSLLTTPGTARYGYENAYLSPTNAVHIRELWLQGTSGIPEGVDWVQDGTYVYLDNATDKSVYVDSVVVPGTSLWSANFCRGVQLKLEAVILRAIKEEAGEALRMEELAENHFQRARTNSSRSRSATPFYKPGPIASARFRRGTT